MRTIVRFSKKIKPNCCGRTQFTQITKSVNKLNKNVEKINKELDIVSSYGVLNCLILNTSFFIWLVKG